MIGAGAFGGWTALYLQRLGARVTLLDAWGPGNARASSGGESRVIRGIYGPDRAYVELVVRAFELWTEWSAQWQRNLYTETGALWMFSGDDSYARSSIPLLDELGFAVDQVSLPEARRRFQMIDFSGIDSVYFEPRAGYLLARDACDEVVRAFVDGGGEYCVVSVQPGTIRNEVMGHLRLSDGSSLNADKYVFACGPWLGPLFPDVLGELIRPTRQEVFYFGTPSGNQEFDSPNLPVWVDVGERIFYGIPGVARRGFKIADDTHGPPFNPTSGDRVTSARGLSEAREFLARRFPDLKNAPLVESRVCQYENSPDGHYIIDRHPGADNVWIIGGGSGHGFKMGPALGEFVATCVLSDKPTDALFKLNRFDHTYDSGKQIQQSRD